MSFGVLIGLALTSMTGYCGENYSKSTEAGILARLDLINSVKIGMGIAKPRPTKVEREAAVDFVRFLNSAKSDEYLEAFYANSKVDNANRFQQFLNGILYNGNPALPIWKAADTLTKMMKTKTDPAEVERLRELAKTTSPRNGSQAFARTAKIVELDSPDSAAASRRQINYLEVYHKPVVLLKTLLASVVKNLYGVKLD